MSSYRVDSKTNLPLLYLKNNKQSLWEKFEAIYPDGIKRTSFMARLTNGRYVYHQDLGGLCSICNEYGYEVFDNLINTVNLYIEENQEKNNLINAIENLWHHLRREFEKEIIIKNNGTAIYDNCINHCLLYTFNKCTQEHKFRCPTSQLSKLDNDGAIFVYDYKMRILPKSARETKEQFFGKRGWTLHTILVFTKKDNSLLDVQAYDHWSTDTKQNAWFTASSFDAVFEILDPKLKWIKIFSDNGGHYHNSELMTIVAYWNQWYNIDAKSSVDSHHAQIAHAIKRYIRIGNSLDDGKKIETAINNLGGTAVANIEPIRNNHVAVKTISGITKLLYFEWPIEGQFADENINNNNENSFIYSTDLDGEFELPKGWALKSNQKFGQRGSGKRMTTMVKTYLKAFFLAGNINKTDRMSAKEMVMELEKIVETGEIQQNDIPTIKTVEAWITRYAASLRREAAEQRVAESSNSNNAQGKNNNEIYQSALSNTLEINKTSRKYLGDISNNININKRQKN
ncbi:hypothetical protein Glove_423g82 [Diversispora epigaea]|uniref:Uncharacterized protein n=1 Tax=Diversispora epigaea TaxID=1348612 RepID=A0A397H2Y5_9GLOM|nr:hypothetical protein Glove_423g82 [Diversispora epigaea]